MAPRSTTLAVPLLIALACTPPAAPPAEGEPALGGASFVVWPPAEGAGASSPEDNPWLTGVALASGGSAGGTGGALGESPGTGGGLGEPGATGGLTSTSGGAGGSTAPGPARLLLRAYVESSGSFKGVMVEHVGGGPSAACFVELFSNGKTELWRSLAVPAGLELGERAVLCVPEGATLACTVGFGGSVFNGNDALVLTCAGQTHDVIGVVGVDPGKGWTGPGSDGQPLATVDEGLWRCGDGAGGAGAANGTAFDTTQWLSWDWASDPDWQGPLCPDPDAGLAGAGGQ